MTKSETKSRQAQKATLVVSVVLLMATAWNVWQGYPVLYWPMGTVSIVLLLIVLFSAAASRKFYDLWMIFAHKLGYINGCILLSAIYFLIVTPYGLTLRLLGRDTMNRRRPSKKSYWISKPKKIRSPQQFERLF